MKHDIRTVAKIMKKDFDNNIQIWRQYGNTELGIRAFAEATVLMRWLLILESKEEMERYAKEVLMMEEE